MLITTHISHVCCFKNLHVQCPSDHPGTKSYIEGPSTGPPTKMMGQILDVNRIEQPQRSGLLWLFQPL